MFYIKTIFFVIRPVYFTSRYFIAMFFFIPIWKRPSRTTVVKTKANFLSRCNVIGFAENNKLAGLYLVTAVPSRRRTKVLRPCLLYPCESRKCTFTRFQQTNRRYNHPPTNSRWRPRSLDELKGTFRSTVTAS